MKVLGFDIGGTKSAVIYADMKKNGDLRFLDRFEIKTSTNPKADLGALCGHAKVVIKENKDKMSKIRIGVSCGGPLCVKEGRLLNPPNLKGWENFQICNFISEQLSAKKVMLLNDADACCLAEWKYGAGRGFQNIVFLTFGTGLGAGLLLNGELYSGSLGFAGEVGHMRISDDGPSAYNKVGSFEAYCSGSGIRLLAIRHAEERREAGIETAYMKELASYEDLTAKHLADCAADGDKDALYIFGLSGRKFGEGLSIIIDMLNPDAIIAGSVYAKCHEWMDEEMYAAISKEALSMSSAHCKILPTLLNSDIGDYGAVMAATYKNS